MSACIFCKIVEKAMPAQIVVENEHLLAFNDISPQAPVHVLFIPKKHIATLNDLQDGDADLVTRLVTAAQQHAQTLGIADDGYRVVLNCNRGGGQTVFHLHLHLLGGRQLRALG